MADFSDVLRTAATQRAAETMVPLRESFTTLRDILTRYETAAELVAVSTAVNAMLVAIGQAPQPVSGDPPPTAELVGALRAALALIEPPMKDEPAPVTPAPMRVAPPKLLSDEDEKAIQRIVIEVSALRQSYIDQHPVRLGLLLQALVAEARHYAEKAGASHPLSQDLSRMVGMLGYVRGEAHIKDFIKGLARDHRADWQRLASEARRKLAQFDADAATPTASRPSTVRRKDEGDDDDNAPPAVIELPHVHALLKAQGNGVLIVGGEHYRKLPLITARYDIQAEFVGADGGSPNKLRNLCAKIKGGSFAAVIGLEGFMAHKEWKPLEDACHSAGVPLIEAGRGGVGAMGQALVELDRRLGQAKTA